MSPTPLVVRANPLDLVLLSVFCIMIDTYLLPPFLQYHHHQASTLM